MLSFLCWAALSSPRLPADTLTLEPTDDAWVYQFAEDQVSDPFLRAWGSDEGPVGKSFEGHLSFSYSCLKFSLPARPQSGPLTGAKLVLMHAEEPAWTKESAEKHPLEARMLSTEWEEENWTYDMAKKVHPTAEKDALLGSGWAEPRDDKPFEITIDLMGADSPFKAYFEKALASSSHELGLALTTSLLPEGDNSVYKVYSRNNEPNLRPKLVLTFGG